MYFWIFKKILYKICIKYKCNIGKCNLYVNKIFLGVLCGSDLYRDNLIVEDFVVGEFF